MKLYGSESKAHDQTEHKSCKRDFEYKAQLQESFMFICTKTRFIQHESICCKTNLRDLMFIKLKQNVSSRNVHF